MADPNLSNLNTPPWLLRKIELLSSNGRIGLDPCTNATSMVNAITTFDEEIDGLKQSWRGHGLVFMNPPHSQSPYNIEPWMAKARAEFIDAPMDGDQLVTLIPGKPDTAWFHDVVVDFRMKCFIRGRIKYWQNGEELPGAGRFPSLLTYHGRKADLFAQIFGRYGWIPADAATFGLW